MTVYEVLKQNIQILEGMRIPTRERGLWDAVQAVLANTRACVSAMEREREEAEKQEMEEGQAEEIGTGEPGN